jgi:hypothetical protein
MIVIPFVPGTFASTVEYTLRAFTEEYKHNRIQAEIGDDGSMHGYRKLRHITTSDQLKTKILSSLNSNDILTPIYPFSDLHTKETIDIINLDVAASDAIIFLYIDSIEYAEINMLFQYYKISVGLNLDIGIFIDNSDLDNIKNWNKNYTHWKDMQPWEFREWISMFYVKWVQEWIDAVKYMPRGLLISNKDLLDDTANTLKKIINYCDLTEEIAIDNFAKEWRAKQQYVLDEYNLIDRIVDAALTGKDLTWNKLHIIAESIIQQKLRSKGYNIKCWMLNEFPTNANTLTSLLERIQ